MARSRSALDSCPRDRPEHGLSRMNDPRFWRARVSPASVAGACPARAPAALDGSLPNKRGDGWAPMHHAHRHIVEPGRIGRPLG